MSNITVQYDEGSSSVTLGTGTRVERGVPVSVPEEVGKRLLKQGWRETKAKASSPSIKPKKATTKTVPQPENKVEDTDTTTTTADTPKEND